MERSNVAPFLDLSSSDKSSGREERLLLLRFSALGDILMTVPVIKALALLRPNCTITVVSRPFVGSIFQCLPENVQFVGINPRQYPGLGGLGKMYGELKKLNPTHVCDLHDVLRTKYLRWRFKMAGTPTSHIIKDRKARKAFLKATHKVQQETSFERYAKAIARLGLVSYEELTTAMKTMVPISLISPMGPSLMASAEEAPLKIGIAPFAAHQGKIYPLDLMEKVVSLLDAKGVKTYLFGAGEKERDLMEMWASKYGNAESMVGTLPNMAEELKFIAKLDAMLTMDSGNMHLASLTSVPVYSIWGATHPLGGFLGWGQPMERCIQLDMPCRPCSIFGNKPCQFGDYRCLSRITPEEIVSSLFKL